MLLKTAFNPTRMHIWRSRFSVVSATDGDAYANDITRFSNKQNAIRGKDFIALEAMYRDLKAKLEQQGFFSGDLKVGSMMCFLNIKRYDILERHMLSARLRTRYSMRLHMLEVGLMMPSGVAVISCEEGEEFSKRQKKSLLMTSYSMLVGSAKVTLGILPFNVQLVREI